MHYYYYSCYYYYWWYRWFTNIIIFSFVFIFFCSLIFISFDAAFGVPGVGVGFDVEFILACNIEMSAGVGLY